MYHLLYNHLVSPDGTIEFSEIKTFLEKKLDVTSTYKSITTSRKNTITLTGNHLVCTKKSHVNKFVAV